MRRLLPLLLISGLFLLLGPGCTKKEPGTAGTEEDTLVKGTTITGKRGGNGATASGDGTKKAGEKTEAEIKAIAEEPLSEPDRTKATPDYNPDPDDNDLVKVDFDALPINLEKVKAAIVYPDDCKAAGIKGTVALKVLVDADGWYRKHEVRSSPDKRLTAAVIEQLKKVRYKPARLNGEPVKVWVNFAYTFPSN